MSLTKISRELEQELTERKERLVKEFHGKNLVLPHDPEFLQDLDKVLTFSEFISSSMSNYPEVLMDLIESGDLVKSYSKDEYATKLDAQLFSVTDQTEMKKILYGTRLREMVRIAWQDLTEKADLQETLKDLSNLADACIDKAFMFLYDKLCSTQGTPLDKNGTRQKIIVLGMGKLGARELNFSSDIDLIFACPSGETWENSEKSITNEEFFTKLCRNFLRVFDSSMTDLNLFRVDMRLRPFGTSGPLVMSCSAMEDYYQCQGREWERYALIKARPVAGDIEKGHSLLKALNPFIYRRYFDYGTFDSFRDMKKRISFQIKDKRLKNNIKLGTGGIREIEFFCQIFQLVRGGVEPEFQEPSLLKILNLLAERSCIDQNTKEELKRAYVFLRRVEHRLQEYADLQTHDLPEKACPRQRVAISMGFDTWNAFFKALAFHRKKVHEHFNHLLLSEQEDQDQESDDFKYLWAHLNDPQAGDAVQTISGFKNPEKIIQLLKTLAEHPNTKKLPGSGEKRLDKLVPMIVRKAGETGIPETVLSRFVDLIITIERRTCYISLLLENPGVLDTLAVLAEKSHWIISFLSQHPALLDELVDPKTLYKPPGKDELEQNLNMRMLHIPCEDFEFQLEELCLFKQVNTLRLVAADIIQNYPLMKVSDHLTYIAEIILNKVIEISWNHITAKYGSPVKEKAYNQLSCGFAAIAYGKLGGIELGYKSDLDLVFIHTGNSGETWGGKKSIEKKRFYTLLCQRIINALTIHTSAGTLYEADMRLRPSGKAGAIVSHIDAFKEYTAKQAWTWEHQAIIRARPVCGDKKLQKNFDKIRKEVLLCRREPQFLKQAVRDMRERLREEHGKYLKNFFDLKQEKGGIVDIEFLVQYLVLKHSHDHPVLAVWTDNVRLLETLAAQGILSHNDSETLKNAYLTMRESLHRLSLQDEKQTVPLEFFAETKEKVVLIYKKMIM
ncbi:MAG: bifunctional [glutamate--ammonia ligase]-adenylyl-L-tyrosine phosphorylase/[glutamate--ammonia-ligase] adenylyltransferase [Thermodesulfobacteriota bacterium]|nr:bifunctional [glutamate--ammonia ligase]-adenylyl-L-tyrosine phosphorylase/[glutamate--ammonia-ligase] adenylyltransferase [Thermodesulfobacteriota bacterium]